MNKTTKKSAPTSATVTTPAPSQPAAPVIVASKPAALVAPAVVASKFPPAPEPTKPVAAATPVVSKPAAPTRATTTIEAKIDVGFGNQLFVRGQGEGLSWDRGIPLECVDSKTWRLIVPAKDKLQFKLLINDSVWAKGEDVVVTPGKRVELVPAF